MDHGWALRAVHDDQFEEPASRVGSENQVAGGVFGDLFHDDGITQRMLDLLDVNSVPICRQENVHLGIVVQNHPGFQQNKTALASTRPVGQRPQQWDALALASAKPSPPARARADRDLPA